MTVVQTNRGKSQAAGLDRAGGHHRADRDTEKLASIHPWHLCVLIA
jgi:hypothetical protein